MRSIPRSLATSRVLILTLDDRLVWSYSRMRFERALTPRKSFDLRVKDPLWVGQFELVLPRLKRPRFVA